MAGPQAGARAAASADLVSEALVPLLEAFNPQDREPWHAPFVGGSMPAGAGSVDFLAERLGAGSAP